MTMISIRAAALVLALAGAAPAIAQTAAPASPAAPMMAGPHRMMPLHGPGGHGGMRQAFATLSEAGQAVMNDAMRLAGNERRAEHEALKGARDRMLTILEADKLDTAALKRAMDDERSAANASRTQAQAAMLAGFTKLSAADRKAFVNESRVMKARMEMRVKDMHGRMGGRMGGGRGGMDGPGGDMPPPSPGM